MRKKIKRFVNVIGKKTPNLIGYQGGKPGGMKKKRVLKIFHTSGSGDGANSLAMFPIN